MSGDENATNKEAINKEAINKDAINKDAINKDAINEDAIKRDITLKLKLKIDLETKESDYLVNQISQENIDYKDEFIMILVDLSEFLIQTDWLKIYEDKKKIEKKQDEIDRCKKTENNLTFKFYDEKMLKLIKSDKENNPSDFEKFFETFKRQVVNINKNISRKSEDDMIEIFKCIYERIKKLKENEKKQFKEKFYDYFLMNYYYIQKEDCKGVELVNKILDLKDENKRLEELKIIYERGKKYSSWEEKLNCDDDSIYKVIVIVKIDGEEEKRIKSLFSTNTIWSLMKEINSMHNDIHCDLYKKKFLNNNKRIVPVTITLQNYSETIGEIYKKLELSPEQEIVIELEKDKYFNKEEFFNSKDNFYKHFKPPITKKNYKEYLGFEIEESGDIIPFIRILDSDLKTLTFPEEKEFLKEIVFKEIENKKYLYNPDLFINPESFKKLFEDKKSKKIHQNDINQYYTYHTFFLNYLIEKWRIINNNKFEEKIIEQYQYISPDYVQFLCKIIMDLPNQTKKNEYPEGFISKSFKILRHFYIDRLDSVLKKEELKKEELKKEELKKEELEKKFGFLTENSKYISKKLYKNFSGFLIEYYKKKLSVTKIEERKTFLDEFLKQFKDDDKLKEYYDDLIVIVERAMDDSYKLGEEENVKDKKKKYFSSFFFFLEKLFELVQNNTEKESKITQKESKITQKAKITQKVNDFFKLKNDFYIDEEFKSKNIEEFLKREVLKEIKEDKDKIEISEELKRKMFYLFHFSSQNDEKRNEKNNEESSEDFKDLEEKHLLKFFSEDLDEQNGNILLFTMCLFSLANKDITDYIPFKTNPKKYSIITMLSLLPSFRNALNKSSKLGEIKDILDNFIYLKDEKLYESAENQNFTKEILKKEDVLRKFLSITKDDIFFDFSSKQNSINESIRELIKGDSEGKIIIPEIIFIKSSPERSITKEEIINGIKFQLKGAITDYTLDNFSDFYIKLEDYKNNNNYWFDKEGNFKKELPNIKGKDNIVLVYERSTRKNKNICFTTYLGLVDNLISLFDRNNESENKIIMELITSKEKLKKYLLDCKKEDKLIKQTIEKMKKEMKKEKEKKRS